MPSEPLEHCCRSWATLASNADCVETMLRRCRQRSTQRPGTISCILLRGDRRQRRLAMSMVGRCPCPNRSRLGAVELPAEDGGAHPIMTWESCDQFLYLLAEMEAVTEHRTIRCNAESAVSVQQLLDRSPGTLFAQRIVHCETSA